MDKPEFKFFFLINIFFFIILYTPSIIYSIPTLGSKHLFFNKPINNCNPPIAKIIKKNNKIIIESISSLIAENKEFKITFNAWILEIVLRGLSTLSTLKEANPDAPPPPLNNLGSHLQKKNLNYFKLNYFLLNLIL